MIVDTIIKTEKSSFSVDVVPIGTLLLSKKSVSFKVKYGGFKIQGSGQNYYNFNLNRQNLEFKCLSHQTDNKLAGILSTKSGSHQIAVMSGGLPTRIICDEIEAYLKATK